ncbi:hypothetical protein [Staphylococcus aureus]
MPTTFGGEPFKFNFEIQYYFISLWY